MGARLSRLEARYSIDFYGYGILKKGDAHPSRTHAAPPLGPHCERNQRCHLGTWTGQSKGGSLFLGGLRLNASLDRLEGELDTRQTVVHTSFEVFRSHTVRNVAIVALVLEARKVR